MTTAQLHFSPARQRPIPASLEQHALLPPNIARISAQPEHAEQALFAIALHKGHRRALKALAKSKLHHVNGVDTNCLPSLTVEKVTANLAGLANRIIAGLTFSSRLMMTLGAISKCRDDSIGLWHRLHAGNEGLGFWEHQKVSLFDEVNIRNIVPNCKRCFA